MKKLGFLLLFLSVGLSVKAQDKKVYFLSLKYPKTSIKHEILVTPFFHHAKSPQVANYYYSSGDYLIPQPVYNRVYSVASLSYQPKLRLVEIGSKFAIALRIPLTFGLSFSDLRTKDGERWSPPTLDPYNVNSRRYDNPRYNGLGSMHIEGGALLGVDYGFGSTAENTNEKGISLGVGINHISSPLILASNYDVQGRDLYKGYLSWNSLVSQVGIHFRKVSLYYVFSFMPTRVYYKESYNISIENSVLTNTYQRFSIGFNL